MRAATTMRPVAALTALLLAGASTGAHAQFSGDPGPSAGDTPPSAPAAESGGAAERGDRHQLQAAIKRAEVDPTLKGPYDDQWSPLDQEDRKSTRLNSSP